MEQAISVSVSKQSMRGPRMDPRGTPDKTFFVLDLYPSTETLCCKGKLAADGMNIRLYTGW